MSSPIKSRSLPISVENLKKAYGGAAVLDDICLQIDSGEFLTLLGPSGSGKTTLLMAIAGFVRPDSGDIAFDGHSVVLDPPHKRGIGMVFQSYALFPHMTVGENIGYPLKLRKLGRAEIRERVDHALELVQLQGLAQRRISQLSGGQRQRVALARAIVFEPSVLLMDEPLSALDKKLREQMQIEIRRLHDRLAVTTVYVTHDQREALTLSDRIAVLDKGRIAQVAGPHEIYERPSTRFIADFIGESHFLPVHATPEGYSLGQTPLLLTDSPSPTQARNVPAVLVVRPEMLTLLNDAGQDATPMNRLAGVVTDILYQGDSSRFFIRLDAGGEISLRLMAAQIRGREISIGKPVVLGLHPQDTIIVAEESPRA